ncbi:hypothetical protein PI124_g15595 [Phytophthora idaei]|nr:hypothetical protein PI125_g24603 [Phytophthora idaei]KAG3125634.1 hypothetical protein PI126_g22678 [Phytophthora idaei]KAG3239464.1 hypothetical protein PI124_g15595 [Phytophthora idaei]
MAEPMKYSNKGVPKNWNYKEWQTYKWAMLNVFQEHNLKDIAVGDVTLAVLETASAETKEDLF